MIVAGVVCWWRWTGGDGSSSNGGTCGGNGGWYCGGHGIGGSCGCNLTAVMEKVVVAAKSLGW